MTSYLIRESKAKKEKIFFQKEEIETHNCGLVLKTLAQEIRGSIPGGSNF